VSRPFTGALPCRKNSNVCNFSWFLHCKDVRLLLSKLQYIGLQQSMEHLFVVCSF
jgi:hypothetical protein